MVRIKKMYLKSDHCFKLKMEFIKLCVEKEITEEDVQKYDNMANSLFG